MATTQSGTSKRDPAAATFGERLKIVRTAATLSEADLARKLGVKAKTVRAWEADEVAPRANRLSIICGMLNVSLIWLLAGEGTAQSVAQPDAGPAVADDNLLAEVAALRLAASEISDRLALVEQRLRQQAEDKA